MTIDVLKYFRAPFLNNTHNELLQESVKCLLGVNQEAVDALGALDIHSVFDLACSRLFGVAVELAEAYLDSDAPAAKFGHVASDRINNIYRGVKVHELAQQPIYVIEGIGPKNYERISTALDIQTVRDMAFWPPFRSSREVLNAAYGTAVSSTESENAPAELIPTAGRYATEVSRYTRIFIDRMATPGIEGDQLIDLGELGSSEPRTSHTKTDRRVDISEINVDTDGFHRPATGALLSFKQTWTPQGVSLGQLLHSVSLAPGESTKIAVINWTRQTRTSTDEDIVEDEDLRAAQAQKRAITEIQESAAEEITSGRSTQNVGGETTQSATSDAGGFFGLFAGGSESDGRGTTKITGTTVSSSSGDRSVSAEMHQDVSNATSQQSTVVRSRRASVVQEVTHSEKEEIRTRILTNYNHSHALSMHYYEVVQIYRTRLQLDRWSRVLFVPLRPLNFSSSRVLNNFGGILARNLPAKYRLKLLQVAGMVTLLRENSASVDVGQNQFRGDLELLSFSFSFETAELSAVRAVEFWIEGRSAPMVVVPGQLSYTVSGVRHCRMPEHVTLDQILQIRVLRETSDDVDQVLRLDLRFDNPTSTKDSHINLHALLPAGQPKVTIARFSSAVPGDDLIDFLNRDRLMYSQIVWMSLNQSDLAFILGRYSFGKEPLAEVIDMRPLTVFGNYLVFAYHPRLKVDKEWDRWKSLHIDEQAISEDLIPVPTDGLFAEAILGRSNASEKLDVTRFWDWQESPIPMQAPDIGPVQAGQHTVSAAPLPSALGAPVVSYQQIASLPDPTGLAPMLQVMQSDLFRDMSGLEETAASLRAAVGTTGAGASHAAELTTQLEHLKQETLGRLMDAAVQAASQAAMAAAGGEAGGAAAAGQAPAAATQSVGPLASASNSRTGAMLNHAKTLDQRQSNARVSAVSGAMGNGEGGVVGGGAIGGGSGGGSGGPINTELDTFRTATGISVFPPNAALAQVGNEVMPQPVQVAGLDNEVRNLIVAQTAVFESRGDYRAMNLDTEFRTLRNHSAYQRYHIGLSYGIVQFTQDSGTLGSLLRAMHQRDSATFNRIFGDSAAELIEVTTRAGSTSAATPPRGVRVQQLEDADLWEEPWVSRFRTAGDVVAFQEEQRLHAIRLYLDPIIPFARWLGLNTDRGLGIIFDRAVHMGVGGARAWIMSQVGPIIDHVAMLPGVLEGYGFATLRDFQNVVPDLPSDGAFGPQTHAALCWYEGQRLVGAAVVLEVPNRDRMLEMLEAGAVGQAYHHRVRTLRATNVFTDAVLQI